MKWQFGILGIALLALSGCGVNPMTPYLGRWHADFTVDKVLKNDTETNRKRESLHGYLQVYATENRFKMLLEGEQQGVALSGNWTLKGDQLRLKFGEIKIDDRGGSDLRDPNLKYIESDVIRATYSRDLILNRTRDHKRLVGLEITMGNLLGHHEMNRSLD